MPNGNIQTQTYSDFLPPDTVVALRDESGGVDGRSFLAWARIFVEIVKHLTAGGRKLMLIYDSYRAQLSIAVLELFKSNNIVVLALPAHTSGKLQPCDLVVFGELKRVLQESVSGTMDLLGIKFFDMYDFCALLRHAYETSFTTRNVSAGFRRSRIWLLDTRKIITGPLLKDTDEIGTLVSPEQLLQLYEEKRECARKEIIGEDVITISNSFVNSTRGAVMTGKAAMAVVRDEAAFDAEKRRIKEIQSAKRELRLAVKYAKEQEEITRLESARWIIRAKLARQPTQKFRDSVRILRVGRAVAAIKTIERKSWAVVHHSSVRINRKIGIFK